MRTKGTWLIWNMRFKSSCIEKLNVIYVWRLFQVLPTTLTLKIVVFIASCSYRSCGYKFAMNFEYYVFTFGFLFVFVCFNSKIDFFNQIVKHDSAIFTYTCTTYDGVASCIHTLGPLYCKQQTLWHPCMFVTHRQKKHDRRKLYF